MKQQKIDELIAVLRERYVTKRDPDGAVLSLINAFEEMQKTGVGVHIGRCDKNGRSIRIGDKLSFDEKEWGHPLQFTVRLRNGEIVHPGGPSDLTSFCEIVESA